MSNPVTFTINTLQISAISPASGAPGTSVTITGAGFGTSQGSGSVLLGSTNGVVVRWSDTQIVATVAPSALTGIVDVQQNGQWSNAMSFTVPGGNVTLLPNLIKMVVGDTHAVQALGSNGQSVTGLTWASSDTNVVSLSTDDPPILTAVAAGHVTITAGDASTDVTVFADALPLGTVLWSNLGARGDYGA
jgi:IPT/TIG domain